MRRAKSATFLFALTFLLFSLSGVAHASRFPESPYTIELLEGSRIFHMEPARYFSPGVITRPGDAFISSPAPISYSKTSYIEHTEDIALESGLYDVVNNMECLYRLDSSLYIYEGNLYLSEDGSKFFSIDSLDNEAICFYDYGKKEKSYTASKLMVDTTKKQFTSEGKLWEDYKKRNFDAEKGILFVTAMDGTEISLDVNTGGIISKHYPASIFITLVFRTIGAIIIIILLLWRFRKKKEKLARSI